MYSIYIMSRGRGVGLDMVSERWRRAQTFKDLGNVVPEDAGINGAVPEVC